MKRKIIALCLIVAMLGVAVIGGTMAYFTDTEQAVNVMTIGSVKIEQIEEEWNETEGKLQSFTQAKELLPYVGKITGYDKVADGYPRFAGIKNAIDKFVSVKNTGKSDAYVRTFIALEVGTGDDDLLGISVDDINNPEGGTAWAVVKAGYEDIDDYKYYVMVFEHQAALQGGEQTIPCFRQLYLDSKATQEDAAKLDGNGNGTYDILAFTQAVQASGFASARDAFKAAFDDNSDTIKLPEAWTSAEPIVIPTVVNTAADLQAALDAATGTTSIVLGDDIVGNVTATQKPDVKVIIDGNGKSFDGAITVDGGSARHETAAITIKNVNFKADKTTFPENTAFVNLGGNNNIRYTHGVTVSNCTFDAVEAKKWEIVAIKSYTGGDWNLTVEDCEVSANVHSLLQVANVEKNLVVSGCEVYSKNGINLNSTPSAVISDCTFDVQGYALRVGTSGAAEAGKTFLVKDSTLKSACEASDDAVIVIRDNAAKATITLENTTLTGTRDILGGGSANIIK